MFRLSRFNKTPRVGALGKIRLLIFVLFGCSQLALGCGPSPIAHNVYYVSTTGSDSSLGSQAMPWKTIQQAVGAVTAGDTIFLRGGEYQGTFGGFSFRNSGTASQPITMTNYPGEQAVIKLPQPSLDYRAFLCWATTTDPASWQTPKAEYIRIVATDVPARRLSNGVQSSKGIVIQGPNNSYNQAAGIEAAGCSYWEVAGVDFIDVGYGIFAKKRNYQTMRNNSSDHWSVHDNRVYGFFRESGMQFNGNYNTIEHNEISKVNDVLATPFGCQELAIDGHHNTIIDNRLSRQGSTAQCGGILLEWDLSDFNTIEKNQIYDVWYGIDIAGGDNNLFRNNLIYATSGQNLREWGIKIESYDGKADWPCDELVDDDDSVPANNPADPEYPYYYNPRDCHSTGNQVYNNTISGYDEAVLLYQLAGENTTIRNNALAGWSVGALCLVHDNTGQCAPLPSGVMADHNLSQGNFGFTDPTHDNFHPAPGSALIDSGASLGNLVPDDLDHTLRPKGQGYDIGAYEEIPATPNLAPSNMPTLTATRPLRAQPQFGSTRGYGLLLHTGILLKGMILNDRQDTPTT